VKTDWSYSPKNIIWKKDIAVDMDAGIALFIMRMFLNQLEVNYFYQ